MKHNLTGETFHGFYALTLMGSPKGFDLSAYQIKKYGNALCPYTATIEWDGYMGARLVPAP